MPFASLGLSPSLSNPLARLGYTTPTPVQLKSIPIVLTGADLLAKAQTGTGKTAAFGLPMIDRLLVRGGVAAGMRKPRGLRVPAGTPPRTNRRSIIGRPNAAVLPVPVCALASRSRPVRTMGMDFNCTGVGVV